MLSLSIARRDSVSKEVSDMVGFLSYDVSSYLESELQNKQLWLDAPCPCPSLDGVSGLGG